ncbi:MAG TPA: hypothetical protein VFO22_04780 [Candidatus Udaeobacter sp.]|nr:hypothetical protein [Candidatus Udaeobacter sp.]
MNRHLAPALAMLCAYHVCADAAEDRGLDFAVGEHGLDSLSFNGESLLSSPKYGEIQPAKSLLRTIVDSLLNAAPESPATRGSEPGSVELSYSWGRVACAYRKEGENKLAMEIDVANTSGEKIDETSLRLMELTFPSVPAGGTLEAGMFGFGFKGTLVPLYRWPQIIDSRFCAPVIRVDYGTGALNFCADDLESTVGVPYTTNPPARTRYPFNVTLRDIKPGETKSFQVSFRFGPRAATVHELAGDVIERCRKKYPFQLTWSDHRPIGAIFLASSGINVATNPRRWIMNSGKIDITTDQGKAGFRDALVNLADGSVKILRQANAQGMITWDPEGQEFLNACYYGDPRLVPTLAPEMEFKGDDGKTMIDEYFEKFRAAGLKVGICIRPQQITIVKGKPMQSIADDEHAAQVLKDKIAYAKQRWGCTLFYVDSTTTAGRSLNPDVFKAVHDAYPDVLLIPENESMRYFAYSAPLNSYVHSRVTSTPSGARTIYPKAFSVLMAEDGDRPEDRAALANAVRNGDILLFNAWYPNEGTARIKNIYKEAKR